MEKKMVYAYLYNIEINNYWRTIENYWRIIEKLTIIEKQKSVYINNKIALNTNIET